MSEKLVKAKITFDLVMEGNMPFVEGCYRLEGCEWQVFTAFRSHGDWPVGVRKDVTWKSGVTGVNIIVTDDALLNKSVMLQILSEALGVTEWTEVRGPDSMQLR